MGTGGHREIQSSLGVYSRFFSEIFCICNYFIYRWNHGTQLMYAGITSHDLRCTIGSDHFAPSGNDDSYVAFSKFHPFNHGHENKNGDSSLYAQG